MLTATIPLWWVLLTVVASFIWTIWADRRHDKQLQHYEDRIAELNKLLTLCEEKNSKLRKGLDMAKASIEDMVGNGVKDALPRLNSNSKFWSDEELTALGTLPKPSFS